MLLNSFLVERTPSNNNANFDVNLDLLIHQLIQSKRLIQLFPLNFPFDSLLAVPDDPNISSHYSRIVLANILLFQFSIYYNDPMFKCVEIVPESVFTWSTDGNTTDDEIDEIDIRLGTHCLVSILDRMIDDTSNENWQLNKYLLLEIFKVLNAILEAHETDINSLNDTLIGFLLRSVAVNLLPGLVVSNLRISNLPFYRVQDLLSQVCRQMAT